jgi:hypothetical protein
MRPDPQVALEGNRRENHDVFNRPEARRLRRGTGYYFADGVVEEIITTLSRPRLIAAG